MAPAYVNAFDLLGGEDDDDVTVLYERVRNMVVEDVPTSPRKTRKEYVVFADNVELLEYEDEPHVKEHDTSNGNGVVVENGENGEKKEEKIDKEKEDGWRVVKKKEYVKPAPKWTYYSRSGYNNGNRRGNGRYRRRGRASFENNGSNVANSEHSFENNGNNVANSEHSFENNGDNVANHEWDAGVTVESSNVEEKETDEKKTEEEEVNGEEKVVEVEESAEERKERLLKEQIEKEKEERRKRWLEEQAEEAKKMTLAQYEKILLEKKNALNHEKAEAKRVVTADKELEKMKVVEKKQSNDEVLIVAKEKDVVKEKVGLRKSSSEAKLKRSDSSEKKGLNPVVVGVAQLLKVAPFRRSNGGFGRQFSSIDARQRNNVPPPPENNIEYKSQFPVLGSTPPEPLALPSVPTTNSSAPPANSSAPAGPNRSAPRGAHTGSRGNRSGLRGNRPGSGANRAGYRASEPGANSTVKGGR